jgi:hypothetical protein
MEKKGFFEEFNPRTIIPNNINMITTPFHTIELMYTTIKLFILTVATEVYTTPKDINNVPDESYFLNS